MIRRAFMFWLLCVGAVGCAGQARQPMAPMASAPPAAVASAPAAGVADQSGYKLGVDDKVLLTVFGEDDLSKEYTVGPDGKLSLPLIGDVQAVGRSVGDVSAEVRTKLAAGYLKDPNVSMQISTFRPFFILGEVTKPGEYPYRDGLTVTAAVATAEGFTYRAQKRYVFIKHEGSGTESRAELTPNLEVEPGDTIRIGERYF